MCSEYDKSTLIFKLTLSLNHGGILLQSYQETSSTETKDCAIAEIEIETEHLTQKLFCCYYSTKACDSCRWRAEKGI